MNKYTYNDPTIDDVTDLYPSKITQYLSDLIDEDISGSIRKQFVPSILELTQNDGYEDPIGDSSRSPATGLIHRYADRVVLLVTNECFAYCRFCFRKCKLFDGLTILDDSSFNNAVRYIEQNDAIWEVILSGGDPLTLRDSNLARKIDQLQEIDHVHIVRVHTRAPIVNPKRITDSLVAGLSRLHKPVYFVLHINHPSELTEEVTEALATLSDIRTPLLSQTVLLKGVNDSEKTLAELFRLLIRNHVKPYYLHSCDFAQGNHHFRVNLAEARRIFAALRGNVSGICLPTFILDIPGGHGKVSVEQESVSRSSNQWEVTDMHGHKHELLDENW